ncbi:hypothetical protein [Paracoccus laeviglucosivorans]|nr:hypothetical protein [Paracoccus laeviglucosivorans]
MIQLEIFPDGAEFDHGEFGVEASRELDALLDARNEAQISPAKYLSALRDIVSRHPLYIDGHAHLGAALSDQGRPKLALAACLAGYEIGRAVIPEEYAGPIEWVFLNNRPFLRAAQGSALCYAALGKFAEAVAIMAQMLRWNPDDHQGVRFAIGSYYLRCKQPGLAREIFTAHASAYPPYHYELALLEFSEGNVTAAASSLQRGFASNLYIAEILSGNPDPAPLPLWHGRNFAATMLAREYTRMAAPLWQRTPEALAFLRWLFNQPTVLRHRAEIISLREQLAWEDEVGQRKILLDQLGAVTDEINDGLSKAMVRRRVHPRHGAIWPWQLRLW